MANNIPDPVWLQARVTDLENKVRVLTKHLDVQIRMLSPKALISLYMDANRGPIFDDSSARNWARLIICLDTRQLLLMARYTSDPFPWQPFLYLLDIYIKDGFGLEEARNHLLDAAQGLLNSQGLSKICPRDIMANPLRIKQAALAIRQGRKVDDQKA